ncbi:MAG: peptidoglycan DD-metalloendopeptidase family protein [bacterium]
MTKRKVANSLPIIVFVGIAIFLAGRYLSPRFQTYTSEEVTVSKRDLASEETMVPGDTANSQEGEYVYPTICDTLKKGESIYYLLLGHGLDNSSIHELVTEFNKIFNVKRSFPGDVCTVICDSLDAIQRFEYRRGDREIYVVERKGDGFTGYRKEVECVRLVRAVEGEIRSSLYEAMVDLGLGADLIFAFADIFAWDIDFYVDTRVGDRFRLLFEECRRDERVLEYGRILAAEYVGGGGRRYTAIFFQDSTGHSDYYDPEGRSVRKTFLKSPFKYGYKRISSGFSWGRLHPVRKIRRPHLGVDYAAPAGTPVVATADGVVSFAGWEGGFGRCVKIKHGGGLYTTYGHLSRYGRNIRRGARVKQGQAIGYVGATGLATGPHLDYRFIKNGRYVNPLRVNVPAASAVKQEFKEEFRGLAGEMTAALDLLLASGPPFPEGSGGQTAGSSYSK